MSAWIINKKQSGYHTIKRNKSYLPMVADVYGTDKEARLIAAAPELLAALENLIPYLEAQASQADEVFAVLDAREAIAKAQGGE